MTTITAIDYIVILAYFIFMVGIGLYFMRVNKNARDYFAGGNLIPWWVSGMTLYMANFSAWTFTGAAGFAYSTGWFAILYFGVWSVAYYAGTMLTATKWRRTRSISPVEYTRTRFNKTTQQIFSWVLATNLTMTAGVQLASTCKLLAPALQLDLTVVTLVTGVVILLYTFAGGIWAVSVTDVVQGVILLSITFIVMPLSLGLIGGFQPLFDALPALSLDHVYNKIHYDGHWLISVFFIMSLGVASGQAQRFYSVKDERDAKRVGKFAALLFLTVPLVFGIPPLVAKVLWHDLAQIDFFKPYIGNNPQDLVFIGMCMKLLPNGLIGVFIAAMLAATMSTLSAVYNLVSSIVARDIVQGVLRPQTEDAELLRIGRIASVVVGLVVMVLAIVFINSKLGIFNMMQVFYTLMNIPLVIPIAFGLIFRKASKWSAVASITLGLSIGVVTRYLLGWEIGFQVYAQIIVTSSMYVLSAFLKKIFLRNKILLLLISIVFSGLLGLLFLSTAREPLTTWQMLLAMAAAIILGGSLYPFAYLYTKTNEADDKRVQEFYTKLDTPVDVQKEIFATGRKTVSTFPLVGITTIVMGLLLCLIFLTDIPSAQKPILLSMIALMIAFGIMMWFFGKRNRSENVIQ